MVDSSKSPLLQQQHPTEATYEINCSLPIDERVDKEEGKSTPLQVSFHTSLINS